MDIMIFYFRAGLNCVQRLCDAQIAYNYRPHRRLAPLLIIITFAILLVTWVFNEF